ncbi:uncharacterized protein BO97DRAFT_425462 [Aspergillus homomorphus CBS 101889]|uniref:Uncharacterized protein n=1 Tax=Aspergillus homomorphus (strain CBS 101889) TaxID=1450537 RepID=A0A395HVP3_ASPHC|nr:hypothetical protein BO97DRAFT_425462 [Aspergillus homomorphus CBS 101889]RAL11465.1 hypothetical protein BO97DRAFT_425462 [Aspergillus homomorphus CBS 101889]
MATAAIPTGGATDVAGTGALGRRGHRGGRRPSEGSGVVEEEDEDEEDDDDKLS